MHLRSLFTVVNSKYLFTVACAMLLTIISVWVSNGDDVALYSAPMQLGRRRQVYTSTTGDTNPPTQPLSAVGEERNNISALLNSALRRIGELECTGSGREYASRGGWCIRSKSWAEERRKLTDTKLCRALSSILSNSSVVSFGDGPGLYKDIMESYDQVKLFHAYDGAPFVEENTSGRVRFLDLSVPQYGLPTYDWAICLEVAEHIPAIYEDILIDNIRRHVTRGVIISWARFHQPGVGHVNTKSSAQVQELLGRHGFQFDLATTHQLRKHSTRPVFKHNLHVYTVAHRGM